jgi:hypothetical protein
MKTLSSEEGILSLDVSIKFSLLFFCYHSANAADAKFDEIIGTIEDVIMGKFSSRAQFLIKLIQSLHIFETFKEPKFQQMQDQFMNKNYKHFEDSEENKLIYTTIHKEYVSFISVLTLINCMSAKVTSAGIAKPLQ